MFEVLSDIYFVVYNLYYVSKNDDLRMRARLINRDRGSTNKRANLNYSKATSQIIHRKTKIVGSNHLK
jgi:hypothetical protein